MTDTDFEKLEKEGLIDAFDLKTDGDVLEAKENLLGFFNVLRKIDQRIKKEREGGNND
jgi:hypothetical protein